MTQICTYNKYFNRKNIIANNSVKRQIVHFMTGCLQIEDVTCNLNTMDSTYKKGSG